MNSGPTFPRWPRRSGALTAAALTVVAIATGSVTVDVPGGYLGAPGAAHAQTATQPASPPSAQAARPAPDQSSDIGCVPSPGKLGVSRVVEIDTAQGPRFGQQYHDHDFLREKEVVLTFDDGPLRRHSRMVLDALASHCTRATFFMVGQMAIVDPEMVREIAAAGHTIAIHTWSHKNLHSINAQKAQHEFELGVSAVHRALDQPVSPFFRFPYLADSQAMLNHIGQRHFGIFSIDADSSDYRTKNPVEMQRNIFKSLEPNHKGILLFHDIQFSTAHGIRAVLDRLAKEDYRVVHTVPKGPAVTDPRFDALADAEMQRRHKTVASNPMAARSVVWPLAPPIGVPTEQYNPEVATAPAAVPPSAKAAVVPAAAATVASPALRQRPTPTAAPAPAPSPAAAPASSAPPAAPAAGATDQKPAMRGTSEEEDWRRRVFQN